MTRPIFSLCCVKSGSIPHSVWTQIKDHNSERSTYLNVFNKLNVRGGKEGNISLVSELLVGVSQLSLPFLNSVLARVDFTSYLESIEITIHMILINSLCTESLNYYFFIFHHLLMYEI